jgi:hypothetical protein
MMSTPRNRRWCLPALSHPAIVAETAAPRLAARRPGPFILCCGTCGDLACLPQRAGEVWALHGSSLCQANLARGLRLHLAGRVTPDGRVALGFLLRASISKPEELSDGVCGER